MPKQLYRATSGGCIIFQMRKFGNLSGKKHEIKRKCVCFLCEMNFNFIEWVLKTVSSIYDIESLFYFSILKCVLSDMEMLHFTVSLVNNYCTERGINHKKGETHVYNTKNTYILDKIKLRTFICSTHLLEINLCQGLLWGIMC